MKIIISLIVLGVVIIIHELGHFLSAKLFKIPVSEFSIGMGAEVYTYEGDKTTYSLRAIPVGGYVNIKGMEIGDETQGGFNKRSPLVRFIVLFAGVFMNFILSYFIIFGMIYSGGELILNTKPVVGKILPSQNSGDSLLKAGDLIVQIENKNIKEWKDIRETIENLKLDKSKTLDILIEREGKREEVSVPIRKDEKSKKYYIGIIPEYEVKKYSFLKVITKSFDEFINIFENILSGFSKMIKGEVKRGEVSGPIGIINIVGEASEQGIRTLFWLVAVLSINIGIFNLLPFPALDGGRIIFVILEMFGIKVNKKIEERIHRAGIFLIFILIILVTTNDVFNFKK